MKLRTNDKIAKNVAPKRVVDFTNENNKNDVIISNKSEGKSIKKSVFEKLNSSKPKINDNEIISKTILDIIKVDETKLPKVENSKINNKSLVKTEEKINIHKNHRQRLKNQFLENGINALTDIQKLELLLFFSIPQKDTNPIAHELLNKFGSIKEVLSAEPSRLMDINGIKENSATLIKLINSLFSCINKPQQNDSITSVCEAKDFCTKLYSGSDIEQFYVICLTKANKVKSVKMLKSGSSDEVNVQIRNITEFALETKCNRIIISHNHPHGYGDMSDEDCSFTYSLVCSCLLNSIEIIDHIIVGIDKTVSMASQRVLQKLKERAVSNIQISRDKISQLSSLSEDYKIDE